MTTLRVLLLAILFLNQIPLSAQSNSNKIELPPSYIINEFRQLYEQNKSFKSTIDDSFEYIKKNDANNYWYEKSPTDLFKFVEDWYYFLPLVDDGLTYIRRFEQFYKNNPKGLEMLYEEPGKSWLQNFAIARGKYMDSKASRKKLDKWLKDALINIDDYQVPEKGFQSFNEFFTRDLKLGARTIDSPTDKSIFVSPADCELAAINYNIKLDTKINTKGSEYLEVAEILSNSKFAKKFKEGTVVTLILVPTSYHHFHSPVSGKMLESNENLPGAFYDRSKTGTYHRGYYIIDTEKYGHIAMVPIGLATINSINFEEKFRNVKDSKPVEVQKGEKLGHFAYGGSKILIFMEKEHMTELSFLQGQRIGRMKN
ncbi:phosphatidylserine decarboxylase [Tenacibaculum sp. MAR_2009_124]|uniref:phosphatidylserine decarboxylase n=1 Tax=Tenacibaculum sp. MAR_2009_124 TaxID=1250059 RepID=UPI00089D9883|nr:phosphatidylserine decarboxylase [Tenacibaculum sp. MAR_2009_124]SEB40106.1 phosphatidylserine decarboxylase [Tenacibaculum sp. MAR_2009_124]